MHLSAACRKSTSRAIRLIVRVMLMALQRARRRLQITFQPWLHLLWKLVTTKLDPRSLLLVKKAWPLNIITIALAFVERLVAMGMVWFNELAHVSAASWYEWTAPRMQLLGSCSMRSILSCGQVSSWSKLVRSLATFWTGVDRSEPFAPKRNDFQNTGLIF